MIKLEWSGARTGPPRDHPDWSRLMPAMIDLTGQRYGRLTVLERAPNHGRSTKWLCRCDCGVEICVFATAIRAGLTTSCGCRRAEVSKRRCTIHGLSDRPEFAIWQGIKKRCYNQNAREWSYYGGRGITVCERWLDNFENFYADMGPRPSSKHSIERKDNSLGYSPENCEWVTGCSQANNKRSNLILEHDGKRMTAMQWARELGIKPSTVYGRLAKGWPIAEALAR